MSSSPSSSRFRKTTGDCVSSRRSSDPGGRSRLLTALARPVYLYFRDSPMRPLLYSVLPRPPHPTRDGLAIRNYHLLSALAGGFRVRAFALSAPGGAGRGEYPPGIDVEEVARWAGGAARGAALARSLFSGEAFPILLYRSRELAARLSGAVARERPAWVVAHSYHVATAALETGAPVWVD